MSGKEPKIGWSILPLTEESVSLHLAKQVECNSTVMLDVASRWGRSHLKLHKDKDGYFVRGGSRGSSKRYLGRCKITYFDGEPTLFAYTTVVQDEFETEEQRRWDEKHGYRR